jgi:hypothetical protein
MKEGKMDVPKTPPHSADVKFTDPEAAIIHVGFSDLLDAFEPAMSASEVGEWLHAHIDA